MLEYASRRFTLPSTSAVRFATTMVMIASQIAMVSQVSYRPGNAVRKTRRNAANAAALMAVDMNAVTGTGAPS